MRGEHAGCSSRTTWGIGSSPRARGTLHVGDQLARVVRVIPACAGNTLQWLTAPAPSTGHPRVRGEHAPSSRACRNLAGSSPRARGTLPRSAIGAGRLRVIPACAGNTGTRMRLLRGRSGHPRVRGEHLVKRIRGHFDRGSSPRARGTPLVALVVLGVLRVIPACAGNTDSNDAQRLARPGHPRVRGEHAGTARQWCPGRGSSPRARGTRGQREVENGELRVIPACAGNTARRSLPAAPNTGHPRVRGEHGYTSDSAVFSAGSSPRARGTHV